MKTDLEIPTKINALSLLDRAYLYTIREGQMLRGMHARSLTIVTKVYEVCYDSQTAVAPARSYT
jgi:hypothetical protein